MVKDKIPIDPSQNLSTLFEKIKSNIQGLYNEVDGLKIQYPDSWVQIRASNTEPILRIYAEGKNESSALALVNQIKQIIA